MNLTISLGYVDQGRSVEQIYHINNENSKVLQTVEVSDYHFQNYNAEVDSELHAACIVSHLCIIASVDSQPLSVHIKDLS